MTPKGTMKKALFVLVVIAWTVPASAQGVNRCVDAAGHVYYYGAQPPAGVTCVDQQTTPMTSPQRDADTAREQVIDTIKDSARVIARIEVCKEAIRRKLVAPGSAQFNLDADPVKSWVITGIVDSQNKMGGVLRSAVYCEFSLGDRLQKAQLLGDW